MVSVIVPVYNAEKYIDDCMSGLLGQTYSDLEIIVVDDGSTDRSHEMIERYAADDSRVIYIYKENGGPSSARNIGITAAHGEFICFVDADDIAMANLIEALAKGIRDADVCVAGRIRWNQERGIHRHERCPAFYGNKKQLIKKLPVYFRVMRGVTGRLFKTSVIRSNGLAFREDIHYGEDMYFNYGFFKYAGLTAFIPARGYIYRIHNANSLSQQDRTPVRIQWANQNRCIIDAFFHSSAKK